MNNPSSYKYLKLSLLAVSMQLPAIAIADGPPAGAGAGWRTTLTAAYVGQGNSDLDNNGQFSVDRGIVKFETARRFGQRWFTGISVGYEEDKYTFSNSTVSPLWDDIRTLQFGVSMRYLASDKWTLFGLPILRYTTEKGVDLDEGREIGLLAGASYRFSDKLTLGPGLGVFSGIGGEEDVFPILLVNWKMTGRPYSTKPVSRSRFSRTAMTTRMTSLRSVSITGNRERNSRKPWSWTGLKVATGESMGVWCCSPL